MRRLLNFSHLPFPFPSTLTFPIYGRGGGQEQDRSSTEVSRQIKSSRNIKKIEARSLLHHKPRRRTHTHTHLHGCGQGNWNGNRTVVGVGRWVSRVECAQKGWMSDWQSNTRQPQCLKVAAVPRNS